MTCSTPRLIKHIATKAAVAVFMLSTPVLADDDGRAWVVDEVQGVVAVAAASANETRQLSEGGHLVAPFSITTGNDARLVVSRDGDVISIDGPSQLSVGDHARSDQQDSLISIKQTLGVAAYRLKSTSKRRVVVTTPQLRTYVRGTTFRVDVDHELDQVHLIEGVVDVESQMDNTVAALAAGQTATASLNDGFLVDGQPWLPAINRRSIGSGSLTAARN